MDRHKALCSFMLIGVIPYGITGAVLFRCHGWIVVGLAIVMALWSWCAQCGAGLGHL